MKKYVLIISAVLIAIVAVGGTLAWFTDTKAISNSFSVGDVKCSVDESLNGNKKENVKVKNTGNVDAYIRVNVIASWVDSNDNTLNKEITDNDCDIDFVDFNNSDWVKGTDGYYYYKKPVSPGEETSVFIESATISNTGDEVVRLDILASAIQTTPSNAISESWGLDAAQVLGVSQ